MELMIERIEDAGPDRRARRLVFSDTTERTTPRSVVRELGLAPGDVVDTEALEQQLVPVEQNHARERAIQLLGYRERVSVELTARLTDDGFPPGVTVPLVERFTELGLVDDERFARQYVRSRMGAGYGLRRIRDELLRRGVGDAVIEEALAESGDSDEFTRARSMVNGKPVSSPKERDRLIRRLVSRGFDFRTAAGVVRAMVQETDEPDESCR